MEEQQVYYVRRRGRTEGPWPLSKLKSEVALQKLGKHHEVSNDGANWRRASELFELFSSEIKKKTLGKIEPPPNGNILIAPPGPISTAAMDWYYSVDSNQQVGPLTLLRLVDAVIQGQCPLDALVWREGYGDWLPMEDVPEIMSVLNGAGGGANTAATRFVPLVEVAVRSQKALIALTVGVIAMMFSWVPLAGFTGIAAIAIGSWAAYEIRKSASQTSGMSLAIAGIATGTVACAVAVVILIGLAAAFMM
jgi:hypothetical protein